MFRGGGGGEGLVVLTGEIVRLCYATVREVCWLKYR